jgi:GR25 family glycosyltransferase involved in LPS biosynthesis
MSDIAIGVVGDIRRYGDAWELSQAVNADFVCYDDSTLGCTGNHLRMWHKMIQHGGDWGVVLEDDAQLCDDFTNQLAMVLDGPPASVVSLYLGTGYPRAWQRFIKPKMATGAHWIVSSHLLHCVGVAIRMPLIPDMLRFVGKMAPAERLWPIDEQITHWCRLRGQLVAYTKPSIIEHRDLPTLLTHQDGRRELPRHAWQFGSRNVWDNTAVVEMQ